MKVDCEKYLASCDSSSVSVFSVHGLTVVQGGTSESALAVHSYRKV